MAKLNSASEAESVGKMSASEGDSESGWWGDHGGIERNFELIKSSTGFGGSGPCGDKVTHMVIVMSMMHTLISRVLASVGFVRYPLHT